MKALTLLTLVVSLSWILPAQAQNFDGGWVRINAEYEVPVPENLKSFATFPLNDFRVRDRDGEREIHYTLPLELTGTPQKFRLKTDDQDPSSPLKCQENQCSVVYNSLDFDEQAVIGILKQQNLTPAEFNGRFEVFTFFRHDPEGIIHFEIPKKGY